MGQRGQVPKRDSQRHRGKPPIDGPAEIGLHIECEPPPANEDWHPVAKAWFESLAVSGQSYYFQASDWAIATLIAEEIDRGLQDQLLAVVNRTTERIWGPKPLGASLTAILKGTSLLMSTEADRRRLRLELERRERSDTQATVSWLDQARRSV